MHHDSRAVQSILTPQKTGFLASAPYPYTHTLSPYTGCGFGMTACGKFCYAQFMPNWTNFRGGLAWGELVSAKANAAEVLDASLTRMRPAERAALRIFMASTTDPYQPLEATYRLTRQCLEVFARFDDLDLLVVQTRSPLVLQDLDRLLRLPYVWLSVTIETDDAEIVRRLGGGPAIQKRFEMVRTAAEAGLAVQITVSPCLPYSAEFAARLAGSGARRIVVDDFMAGDGSAGKRTSGTPFAAAATYDWRDSRPALDLYQHLAALGVEVGWSAAGFCGIRPRLPSPQPPLF
jgi:DNA repair photolyase